MTVGELIKVLCEFPLEMQVYRFDNGSYEVVEKLKREELIKTSYWCRPAVAADPEDEKFDAIGIE